MASGLCSPFFIPLHVPFFFLQPIYGFSYQHTRQDRIRVAHLFWSLPSLVGNQCQTYGQSRCGRLVEQSVDVDQHTCVPFALAGGTSHVAGRKRGQSKVGEREMWTLCRFPFTQHNVFKAPSSRCQCFIPFHGQIIFPRVASPPFAYAFVSWWIFNCFLFLWLWWSAPGDVCFNLGCIYMWKCWAVCIPGE